MGLSTCVIYSRPPFVPQHTPHFPLPSPPSPLPPCPSLPPLCTFAQGLSVLAHPLPLLHLPLLNQLLHMVPKTRALLLPRQHAVAVQVKVLHHWNVFIHGLVVVFTHLHRHTHAHHIYSKYVCTVNTHMHKRTQVCMHVNTHTYLS